jgi:hypothetical protein
MAFGSLAFLLLSLVALLLGAIMSSILVVTGAAVIGLAATTTAVLSLRE